MVGQLQEEINNDPLTPVWQYGGRRDSMKHVKGSTVGILLNFCANNPPHRQAVSYHAIRQVAMILNK